MLPVRDPRSQSGPADDLTDIGAPPDQTVMRGALAELDLSRYRAAVSGPHCSDLARGQTLPFRGADVVGSAPELARLSLNIAFAHHDAVAGRENRRLVYGGHTIGLATAQLNRVLPNLVTVLAWESCDHLGPVFEGDSLSSAVAVEDISPLAGGGGLVRMRSTVVARDGSTEREVLDWRLFGAMA
jgi:acyl dehydratase